MYRIEKKKETRKNNVKKAKPSSLPHEKNKTKTKREREIDIYRERAREREREREREKEREREREYVFLNLIAPGPLIFPRRK